MRSASSMVLLGAVLNYSESRSKRVQHKYSDIFIKRFKKTVHSVHGGEWYAVLLFNRFRTYSRDEIIWLFPRDTSVKIATDDLPTTKNWVVNKLNLRMWARKGKVSHRITIDEIVSLIFVLSISWKSFVIKQYLYYFQSHSLSDSIHWSFFHWWQPAHNVVVNERLLSTNMPGKFFYFSSVCTRVYVSLSYGRPFDQSFSSKALWPRNIWIYSFYHCTYLRPEHDSPRIFWCIVLGVA